MSAGARQAEAAACACGGHSRSGIGEKRKVEQENHPSLASLTSELPQQTVFCSRQSSFPATRLVHLFCLPCQWFWRAAELAGNGGLRLAAEYGVRECESRASIQLRRVILCARV